MENRYQKFLKNTLKPGLLSLQQSPLLTEVNGIPLTTFNILVRAFRAGLSDEFKIVLPHDLKNLAYLQTLLDKVEILLSPGIPEETTLANAYSLPWLMENYENAQKVGSEQKKWQTTYNQQVAEFNRKVIAGVQTELEEKLPSLPKEEIIKPLAIDIARTVKEALPYAASPEQAEELVQRVTQTALKNYASTAKEIQKNSELPAQIAQTVAQENSQGFRELIENKIKAPVSPLFNTQLAVEETIATNFPAAARNPKAVKAISAEVIGRIHAAAGMSEEDYRSYLTQTVKAVLAQEKTQQLLQETGTFLPMEKQTEVASNISREITPEAYKLASSPEFAQTPLAGGLPAAPTMAVPPSPPGGPPRPYAGSPDVYGDIFFSQGSPGHILTSLTSPQAGENIAKWIITGGLIRAPIGFAIDSIPGGPKMEYLLDLFGPYLGGMEQGFRRQLAEAQSLPKGSYKRLRQEGEARTHLDIIDALNDQIEQNPWLGKIYSGRNLLFRFLHPVRSIQLNIMQRSLPAGIAVSSLTDILSAYIKYGGYGGGYVTEAVLKNFASFGLKVIGEKIGLYEVVDVYPHQKYVFKPLNQLKTKIKESIYKRIPQGAKDLVNKIAARLGLSASSLMGGIGIALSFLAFLYEPLKKLGKFLVAMLAGLIAQYGTPALIGAIGGGLGGLFAGGFLGFKLGVAIGAAIGGPIGAVVGAIVGTVLGAFFGFFGGAFAGAGLGILLSGLAGQAAGFVSGLLGSLGSLPSLTPYAAPISATALATVIPTAGIYFIVVSTAFEQQGQPAPVQSEYVTVSKGAEFSGKIGDHINYILKVVATKTKITKIKITDTTTATCQGTPPEIPVRTFAGKIPQEILPGAPLVLTYQVPTDPTFNDCLITNTVQVEVDVPELQRGGERAFTTNNVSIGNPPVVMPIGPPLKGNVCLSGYDFNEREPNGIIHNGIDLFSDQPNLYSPFLKDSKVLSVCKSPACLSQPGGYSITFGIGPYVVYAGHLASPSLFNVGDTIPGGALFGTMGSTGNSSGPHVHYIIYYNGKAVDPHSYGVNPPKCP